MLEPQLVWNCGCNLGPRCSYIAGGKATKGEGNSDPWEGDLFILQLTTAKERFLKSSWKAQNLILYNILVLNLQGLSWDDRQKSEYFRPAPERETHTQGNKKSSFWGQNSKLRSDLAFEKEEETEEAVHQDAAEMTGSGVECWRVITNLLLLLSH